MTGLGPGIPMDGGALPEFRGVGLKNIRERLIELYGSGHEFQISENQPRGLRIEIRIPFEV